MLRMRMVALWVVMGILLTVMGAGCSLVIEYPAPTSQCPQCPSSSSQCYIRVTSARSDVWGYIWFEGNNTGIYLSCFETKVVPIPCRCGIVQIVDEQGIGSHWERACPGEEVTFWYW